VNTTRQCIALVKIYGIFGVRQRYYINKRSVFCSGTLIMSFLTPIKQDTTETSRTLRDEQHYIA
jgi:hypothetical protein